jgi:DNA-binding transcriptional ArsR family regulator
MSREDDCLRLAGPDVTWLQAPAAPDPEAVLEALNDPACRRVLRAVTREPRTAKDVAEDCEMPLSTTYRKLRLLSEASLVEERTKISTGGKHAGVYARSFDHIGIDVAPDGTLEVEVEEADTD